MDTPRSSVASTAIDPMRAAASVADRPGTLLLHAGAPGARSILLFDPRWAVRRDRDGSICFDGDPPPALPTDRSPLEWPTRWTAALPPGGGTDDVPWLAGMLGHDLAAAGLGARHDVAAPFAAPDLWLGAYDKAVVFEPGAPPRIHVRSLGDLEVDGPTLAARRERAEALLGAQPDTPTPGSTDAVVFLDPDWHRDAMRTIREHLRRGDVYQINLTGFATARTTVRPFQAFRREAAWNPTEFAAFLHTGDATITSHSPELLLRTRGDRVQTRPIKGTAPTGQGAALAASAKDRAEHVMIVDLCRHDLGRTAMPGTVFVDPLFAPLDVRGLVHLVTHVHGRVPRGARHRLLGDLAPGGSITGAPKRRACEIIAAVERSGRGPYTGSLGGIAPNGDMDWNIAIRTALWQDGAVHFGCGGGIVLDSDPDREFEEARLKATSFFASLDAVV